MDLIGKFYNDTNNNINNLVATNKPSGYYKYNNISNFPDSNIFTGGTINKILSIIQTAFQIITITMTIIIE